MAKVLSGSLFWIVNKELRKSFGCQFYRFLTSDGSIQKSDEKQKKPSIWQGKFQKKKKEEEKERRGPFKYYFDDEERDKNKIVFYEEFFDLNTKKKDRENFMVS